MAGELSDFSESLNTFFRGKARWQMQRNAMMRTTELSFQCEQRTPILSLNDSLIEDTRDIAQLLARRCLDLYEQHHRTIGAWKQEPILTCPACRAPVDLPRESKMDFEFCERQSVLWAERAAALPR